MRRLIPAIALGLVACATPEPAPRPAGHPASAETAIAPLGETAGVLAASSTTAPAVPKAPPPAHHHHGHGGHP